MFQLWLAFSSSVLLNSIPISSPGIRHVFITVIIIISSFTLVTVIIATVGFDVLHRKLTSASSGAAMQAFACDVMTIRAFVMNL